MKYLLMLLLSFPVIASQEINLSHMMVKQKLFGTISFTMNAAQTSYTYYTDSGFGFKLSLARSLETGNDIYNDKAQYSNKINLLTQYMIVYKHDFTPEISGLFSCGLTEYKADWKVDGVQPVWGDNSADSDKRCMLGFQYHFNKSVSYEFNAGKIYEKEKVGYGVEETYMASSGFTWRF